ncbi:MAG: hypothetical protein IKI63_02785 [Clostridia bacterium]|nr:hypothetical protein [Clostridia bacterium]
MAIFSSERTFFMGANTPGGFVGDPAALYDGADGWRAFLIKSGPGTGKSSLMRRVAQRMTEAGHTPDVLICSSDPDSLDGVWMPDIRTCVIDATAPHVAEPGCFGAVETIVSLGDALDTAAVRAAREEILTYQRENAEAHRRVRRFMGAAAALTADSARLAAETLDREKVIRSAERLAARELTDPPTETDRGFSGEQRRFLTAVTPKGIQSLLPTALALCPRVFVLDDEHGVAAPVYLETVRAKAVERGVPLYACPSPLFPEQLEHLLLPTLGVAILTSNRLHKVDFPVYRRIHAARFLNSDALTRHKNRFGFNRRAAKQLLDEAVAASSLAKSWRDRLEAPYIAAMDWDTAAEIEARLMSELLG